MNRTSLKYLLIGLVAGALITGGTASALVSSGVAPSAKTAAAPVQTTAKKATKTKSSTKSTKKKATKKKATAKKKSTKKKPAKKKPAPAPAAAPSTTATPLVGLFRFTPGAYSNGVATGSYIRLVLAGGSKERGPFFPNPSSTATTYTLLSPGTDGGLRTGSFQPAPDPAFGPLGDALANRIIAPQRFAFIHYAAQTSPIDPQTGATVPAPSISVSPDGKLSGQLQAFAAQWNKQNFNVGSPKPDGSLPGLTSPVTGTYDAETHAYTLEWTSQIVGGPFNNFSAVWRFEGTFESGCG
ncbi:MAG: hypothetical protein Q8O56_00595 [Solirubrobacteraceae bacterium]|nr:hypothetical protein [Solirubrobacteraceae bacterium]